MTHSGDLAHWHVPKCNFMTKYGKRGVFCRPALDCLANVLELACPFCHLNSLAPSMSHSQCPALGHSGPYVQDISPFRIASPSLFQVVP